MPRQSSHGPRPYRVVAIALGVGLGLPPSTACATELVPLPVLRLGIGGESSNGDDLGLLVSTEVGGHLHYRLFFFGGEVGSVMADTNDPTTAGFFSVGLPVGVTTTNAIVGVAFTPRVALGDRGGHSITALRLAGTFYFLAGIVTFELGHERWFGDGGSAHVVAVLGLDVGRALYGLIDEGEAFDAIR